MTRSAEAKAHLLFAATIFVGATLLFSCQPIVARMIVPLLGGAPAVWIVCSLCFQALLLAGYGYAHFVGTRLPVRAQVALQLSLVAAVFLVMPVTVDEATVQRLTVGHPTFGLILVLLRTIGLPFFVLSTSSPLLQRWFAELGERDPYHLYAASNAGSMLALLGYPLVVEPIFAVHAQSQGLHTAFALYTVLLLICALGAIRRPLPLRSDSTPLPPRARVSALAERAIPSTAPRSTARERWRQRLVWIGLSFAPSSLLLGATEYVTTDIGSVPLLWVLPLALYLMSFVFAFAKKQPIAPSSWSRALALAAALVAALTLADVSGPTWLVITAHMTLLFLASVVCHRGLAERRPHVSRLTEFYLSMSIGGVLGGAFNGLLAPFLFDDLFEYPIAIGLACIGRVALGRVALGPTAPPSVTPLGRAIARDVGLGVAVGLATFALVKLGAAWHADSRISFVWMFGLPLFFAFVWSERPVRFGLAISGLLLAGMSHGGELGTTIWADRGFFGVLKVTREPEGKYQLLVSGRAMHGKQALEPTAARVPLAYYHPTGPAGDVLGPLPSPGSALPPRRVGVIGLGVGSLAAYARPNDEWTFFELNPAVVDVARHHFTYVSAAPASASVRIEVGDARLRLREGGGARFDILVVDAFSSDAVPTHLVTREALAVYRRALGTGGVLLVHVTNDHVRLLPVFGALAREAGMAAVVRSDRAEPPGGPAPEGKSPSDWVVLTDSRAELDLLLRGKDGWKPLDAPASQSVWTDDYANVLGALKL